MGLLLRSDEEFANKAKYYRLVSAIDDVNQKGGLMRGRVNPREAKRMMQRMGMNMNAVEDVKEVVIKTGTKDIVIIEPDVSILEVQGQKMYQIVGGQMTEKVPQRKAEEPVVAEEDIRLVADQTGKSLEEARKALEESGGDLAKAILLLQS